MGGKLKHTGIFLLQSLSYAAAFFIAWRCSADQFYLPAGLRIAALLFAPYSRWPAIFVGDAAAMLALRIPIAQELNAGPLWPYVTPFLLCALVSIGPLALRKLKPDFQQHERWLPLALLAIAVWGSTASTILNVVFDGPRPADLVSYSYRFSVGQYLAILAVVLPVLLWHRRRDRQVTPPNFLRDAVLSAATLAVMCAIFPGAQGNALKLTLLGGMVVPTVVLAFLHGWRGAVVGFVTADVAIGFYLPDAKFMGDHNMVVFVAQQTLAVVGTFLQVVGSSVSSEFDKAARLDLAERESLHLAQSNHLTMELALRDRVEAMAREQRQIDREFRDAVQQLKNKGQYALAMQITRQAVLNTRMLYDHTSAIYPMQIEHEGLFRLLKRQQFEKAPDDRLSTVSASGSLDEHSTTLQLVSYRLLGHAIEMLAGATRYSVRARAWSTGTQRKIAITVVAHRACATAADSSVRLAQTQFAAKLRAYGGQFRRRESRISFVVAEANQRAARGVTTHDTPLAPLITLTSKSPEL
ncbi:MASE1 domain-containing protein [Xanthomonas theicola]|uniref:MASE1 domain-containing protein n=1 Tax=Xanthomonas theicola TaxID=56464 RepID=A0A2S6ZLV1_9XANT|nr:MASE1 domain-containing protein [Xanthomonas theicola]PPT93243.1 hypothetical protein XthCFBP4691_01125 [Xanthomonas theicola]QNH24823.1 hypothetical protein G4Q83_08780 [Xanthomonas theicola]